MLWYGFLEIPASHCPFLRCYLGPQGLFFTLMFCCRADIISTCVTQPKIARIVSIDSCVLWWQYAMYASGCIMTKASIGYRLCCTHVVCRALEGVWLLALPKADCGKVCPGRSRVYPWTIFSFIHLGCCLMKWQNVWYSEENIQMAKQEPSKIW